MDNKILVGVVCIALSLPVCAEERVSQGDERLSCEAMLCLSGVSPSECGPALEKYYGINGRDAESRRAEFLSLCPKAAAPTESDRGPGE